MKKKVSTILLILVLCIGLSLLLYPTVSDYINSLHQSKAIAGYSEAVDNMDEEERKIILEKAKKYNAALAQRGNMWQLDNEQLNDYNNQLNVSGTAVMSYIEIPSIDCTLPIYHGTDEAVLQIAVGHLEGTSLPVGGESSHCVLSGHRGLPSAKLFTDLDRLVEGDIFVLKTLDEVFTYEVDRISIVLPNEVSSLTIEDGKDLCTLVTCTPYGVNTHRLLVRGHRIENLQDSFKIRITAEAQQIDPLIVAPVLSIPILIIFFICIFVIDRRKRIDLREEDENN